MGETLANYNLAIMDKTADGRQLTPEVVQRCLEVVTREIFPHQALECQCQWIIRDMRKPYDLLTQKYFSAIARMNNALTKFQGATKESKFSEVELIHLLKYSLPLKWQQKFNYNNYVPTEHDCMRLLRSAKQSNGTKLNQRRKQK